jgi:hypothetical protein
MPLGKEKQSVGAAELGECTPKAATVKAIRGMETRQNRPPAQKSPRQLAKHHHFTHCLHHDFSTAPGPGDVHINLTLTQPFNNAV